MLDGLLRDCGALAAAILLRNLGGTGVTGASGATGSTGATGTTRPVGISRPIPVYQARRALDLPGVPLS
ncbi:MAG: hypothetical protein ACREJ2_16295 [Planctomycetota bacterium]